MRGMGEMQEPLFTMVKLEDLVPADYPLRALRLPVSPALKWLNGLLGTIHADIGLRLARCCWRCCIRCAASACDGANALQPAAR